MLHYLFCKLESVVFIESFTAALRNSLWGHFWGKIPIKLELNRAFSEDVTMKFPRNGV